MPKTDEPIICCSFCGKRENQARLIAGPDVYICSDCVQACCDLLREDASYEDMPEQLPTPMEINAFLRLFFGSCFLIFRKTKTTS